MNRATAEAPVLFLHGGPGLNAQMERRRYQHSLSIHWWDQPHIPRTSGQAVESWVSNAEREVKRMSALRGGAIALLASSYGSRIALELLTRIPDLIGAVTISGGVLDIRAAFIRFGRYLAHKGSVQRLHQAVDAAAESPSHNTFWALVDAIMATPNFLVEYWSPRAVEQCAVMHSFAAEGSLLDIETFQAVLNDTLSIPTPSIPKTRGHRIRVLIGRDDPFAETDDVDQWLQCLPTATVERVDTGHYPHLELPPKWWYPG